VVVVPGPGFGDDRMAEILRRRAARGVSLLEWGGFSWGDV